MVLVMLLFSITAFLKFEKDDVRGQCTTLLQCFVSYVYRGLSASSLAEYLPDPEFPQTYPDMATKETARLVWEISFSLITVSMLGAIITGVSTGPRIIVTAKSRESAKAADLADHLRFIRSAP